jgi:hypothetical protein
VSLMPPGRVLTSCFSPAGEGGLFRMEVLIGWDFYLFLHDRMSVEIMSNRRTLQLDESPNYAKICLYPWIHMALLDVSE